MFDIHYFRKDPRPFFKFAKEIYPGQFQPSPCHRFIRCIEKHGKLLRNYTQNIDTLEQVVGISNVVQCHGSFATATCTKPACRAKVSAEQIKKDIVILHPGPINRGVEITSDVADSKNAVILDQVENGVAIRMAIIYLLVAKLNIPHV